MEAYEDRVRRAAESMAAHGVDVILLTKPANMFYLTGDGRLCAYAMITRNGQVALGVPVTDVEDVRKVARFDRIVGFDDEVGMIHSIARYFAELGIREGAVGLEYTFLTQSMMGNCGLYTGPWGVRVEDTVVVGEEGPLVLTVHPRRLERRA